MKDKKSKKKAGIKVVGEPSKLTYVVLLLLYIAAAVFTPISANSRGGIQFMNGVIPITAFAGVLSALSNICLIMMVVFFKKLGFITSILLIAGQIPLMIINVFVKGNLKVHIRWANVNDASNIARLELNASHYENRKEPFTFTHPLMYEALKNFVAKRSKQ